jgi:small-conductance mechanosensitive channel
MYRPFVLCVVCLIGCLLPCAVARGQEQGFPPNSATRQDVQSAAGSSVYALPGASRPQQPSDTRLPPQPPLREPAKLYRDLAPVEQATGESTPTDQAPVEPTQFSLPLQQPSAAESAGATAAENSKSAATSSATEHTSLPTGKAKTPETSGDKKAAGDEPPSSDAFHAASGLAGLKELIPTSLPDAWEKLNKAWHYELFMGVTVEKLTIALVLLLVGYMASKRISAWLANRVLGRLGIGRNNVATIQTIAFYALMAAFTLTTLGALGVPVTVFSFFGGALAVGIGFGSQNIVNNFISGLILLAERPIRVGDVIQIDGATGKVTEIGARSTRITTGSNMEILVPNSTFLQSNVINWTLSDDVISSKVTVGVAYGSPARQVAKLLMQAADQNADVLKDPAPSVSFTNFGEHSLDFELSFWLRLSQSDRGKVESELRFAIDDLFAEHGIIIAYPQRDVHLNLLRPVEVRLTPPAAGDARRAAA